MPERDDKRMLLRAEGRARACEGILRSHFGKRPGTAGSEALRRLRLSGREAGAVRRFRPRSSRLRVAAAVAAAVVLVIALLYALTGPGEPEGRGVQAERQAPEAPRESPVVTRRPLEQRRVRKPVSPAEKRVADVPRPEPEPEQPKPGKPVALAQIGELAGEVRVKRQGSEEWLETGILFSILPGDTLATSSPGQARLDFEGGDYLYLNSNSEVTIEKEMDEVLFELGVGEIYIEKESVEGAMAVDTGFGRVRSRRGRFHIKRLDKDKYLLHVLDGEVECRERAGDYFGKYGSRTRACFECGKRPEEGTQFDSEDAFSWAVKMRPKHRPRGHGRYPGPGRYGPPRRGGPRTGGMGGFFKKLIEQFVELDANGDGRLSIEESRLPEDFWNRLVEAFDADGDGELSAEECRAIPGKMKDRKGPGRRDRDGPQEERDGPDDR